MLLYKNNLKTGQYEIEAEDLANQFLDSDSEALSNVQHGWPIRRGLLVFIAHNLQSTFDEREVNNSAEMQRAIITINKKIKYVDK